MHVVILENDETFISRSGVVGPFQNEQSARSWINANMAEGATARVAYLCDPWEASLGN